MREIDFLHYIPGNSLWHKHDPRFKLMEMIFWTVSALMGSIPTLITTGMILTLIHGLAGSRIRIFRKPLCFWMIMSLAILAAGGLAEPQPPFIIFHWPTPFGIPGLVTGGLRSLRLLVVLMAGQLLTATTDPADLADAVRRSFFFLPRSWSGVLATAITLTLTSIPRLLSSAAMIQDAAFSRGLGERKSIFRRALYLSLPLTTETLHRADLITEALLARCFTSNPTPTILHVKSEDWLLISMSIFPVFASLIY